jgi:hypothetical protein
MRQLAVGQRKQCQQADAAGKGLGDAAEQPELLRAGEDEAPLAW